MIRKSTQGVYNIMRFNWHFYVLAGLALTIAMTINGFFGGNVFFTVVITLALLSIFVSLAVSYYVYDRSHFYDLKWLDDIKLNSEGDIVNIHAGFDETSELLQSRYPRSNIEIWDFFDPKKHTELSIKRARKAYPSLPETISVDTAKLPKGQSFDTIFLIFAAHEIRDFNERQHLFVQLNELLKPNGKIVVVEHLRDFPNFIAFTIGFFHFYSSQTWRDIFSKSNFKVSSESKFTAFVSIYILSKT